MRQFQKLLGDLRRADNDFGLISDGDKIAVGVSGGKDSLLLLKCLAAYKGFGIKKFGLAAITVDCTGGECDYRTIAEFCESLGIEYTIEPSDIFKIVFDVRKEKNPCSLCAKLRRGMLNTAAVRMGCNKVALGHHGDDLIETFLLSMFYEGRLSTFAPSSFLDRTGITAIRPLIYTSEHEIEKYLTKDTLPVIENPCPANHRTQREYMKNLIKQITRDIPIARERMLDAITNADRYNLFPTKAGND
jgi:tRNA(Ile)-lysidine synthase TilS/MesJ